tara:strand:- start:8898 stop:9917 length:1020 start_codon:yes stop_codon:yes gene_type:complete
MKILVTGSAGFIGFHITKYLIEKNKYVIGIDNLNNYYSVSLKKKRLKELKNISKIKKNRKYKFYKADLSNYRRLKSLFKKYKFDYVINLAAQAGVRYSIIKPSAYVKSNLIGFSNILELSKKFKIKHLIYASTSSVYGSNKILPFKESHKVDHPIQFYAATKRANELMAHSYSSMFLLPTTGLRFFTVHGPWGRPDMALYKFTDKISRNKVVEIYNYGNHTRSFTDIDDVVKNIYRLIEKAPKKNNNIKLNLEPHISSSPFRILNIGSSKRVNIVQYLNKIAKTMNKKVKFKYISKQAGDVEHTSANSNLLRKLTKFKVSTNTEKVIKSFVNWYLRKKY